MRRALLAVALCGATVAATAGSATARFCVRATPLTAREQDRLLQVAAIVQRELDATAGAAVLIARSGLDLSRIGQRYSHAAIGVQDHPHGRWSVRQLYYACDEGRPRLFDQGLGGFLSGTEDPAIGYLSIVVLPEAEAKALARAALDKPTALAL